MTRLNTSSLCTAKKLNIKYIDAVDSALKDLPPGSTAVISAHSAGALSLLGSHGEALIKKAKSEYGVSVSNVVTYGAPLARDFTNVFSFLLGLNERSIDKDGDPSVLAETGTRFSRIGNTSDPIANLGTGHIIANQLGMIRPSLSPQANPIYAHTDAYADSTLYSNRDAFALNEGTKISLTGDTIASYALPENGSAEEASIGLQNSDGIGDDMPSILSMSSRENGSDSKLERIATSLLDANSDSARPMSVVNEFNELNVEEKQAVVEFLLLHSNKNFSEMNLDGLDLKSVDLSGANFLNASLLSNAG